MNELVRPHNPKIPKISKKSKKKQNIKKAISSTVPNIPSLTQILILLLINFWNFFCRIKVKCLVKSDFETGNVHKWRLRDAFNLNWPGNQSLMQSIFLTFILVRQPEKKISWTYRSFIAHTYRQVSFGEIKLRKFKIFKFKISRNIMYFQMLHVGLNSENINY